MLLEKRRKRNNRNFQSLNKIQIDSQAIHANFSLLQSLQPKKSLFPVLKSNAYGHGTQQIATILKSCDTRLICVDSYPEAQVVRKFSQKEVLIMWETYPENYKYYNHRWLHVAVWSIRVLDVLLQTWKPWKVHLFLNTWMHREGVQLYELSNLLLRLKQSNLQIVGVMSHFANADENDASFDEIQIEEFMQWVEIIRKAWFDPQYIHHNNSAWLVKHTNAIFTASRTWLWLFGYSPFEESNQLSNYYYDLKPVLTVRSTITAIQKLKVWESVSYGHKWTTKKDTTIAVIPFGYNEWLKRSLRWKRQVKRNDQYFSIVWAICMNLCCIDIHEANVKLWDPIEVIGSKKKATNSINRFAELDNTIVYEVLVNLDSFMKKVVIS